jgi:hypothetical protein
MIFSAADAGLAGNYDNIRNKKIRFGNQPEAVYTKEDGEDQP